MKIAGIILAAALTGWFVRGFDFPREAEPIAPSHPVVVASEPLPAPPSLIQRVPLAGSLGHRNLFDYRADAPRPISTPAVVSAAPVAAAPEPAVIEPPAAPAPIPFPYLYIGTFGTAEKRVAAFKRDGEIVTIRAGERIGAFVLRSIDLETVEVEGPDGTRRIAMSVNG